ncbi:MAG: hypothetical protein D6814_05510 [Calditrichaeota bacterium]|nr:MAG: hypothetical protein D6814_05510 [Calditrichota bacterium]
MKHSARVRTWLALAGLLIASAAFGQSNLARIAFSPYTGEWRGVFRTYSAEGKLIDSLRVHQKYFWEGNTQKVIITDLHADGRKEISHADNFVRHDSLFCVVRKPDGQEIVEIGRLAGRRLIWRHVDPNKGSQEIFKEYVKGRGRRAVYYIDGVGVYGSGPQATILLFEGRYRKIK